MRFNLETSKLLYEVKFKKPESEDSFTCEFLYKDINGRYFIHFECGPYSEYSVKTGYNISIGRKGNYYISNFKIHMWMYLAEEMDKKYPGYYSIIDWEKERQETLLLNEEIFISEEKLPF